MIFVSVPVISNPIETYANRYSFINYNRIYGSKDGKSYDVEMSFGRMNLDGKLRYTGNYSDNQIDIAIDTIMEMNGLSESDIRYAQQQVSDWEKQMDISTKDKLELLTNIASVMGVGEPFQMASDMYSVFFEGQDAWTTAKNMAGTLYGTQEYDLYNAIYSSVEIALSVVGGKLAPKYPIFHSLTELSMGMDDAQRLIMNGKALEIGKFSVNQYHVIQMVIGTTLVSIGQWKKDKARWKDRVEAVNANSFLDSFYDAVNEYLQHYNPHDLNWVLTVTGTQGRYFTFFGSENNYQYYRVALSAAKDIPPGTAYSHRASRANANMPFGTYTGSAAIEILHDLTNFDNDFWNLQIGILPKGWLDSLISVSVFGGLNLNTEDWTHIYRTLQVDKLTFTIPGGYNYQYSTNIPATVGNRDVVTTIPLSSFKDETIVKCEHILDYEWGLANEQEVGITAVDYVRVQAHAEMTNGRLDLNIDNTKALCWIVGMTIADIDQNNIKGGTGWDDNIWANMDSGIKLKVKFP